MRYELEHGLSFWSFVSIHEVVAKSLHKWNTQHPRQFSRHQAWISWLSLALVRCCSS